MSIGKKLDKVVLIDVRTTQEFDLKNIDNSINIPMHEVLSRINEFRIISKPIIVYCRSGMRSGWVTDILTERGINNISNGGAIDNIEILLKNSN